MPSIQELHLWVLARFEGALLALVIPNAPTSTILIGPSIAQVDPTMIHVRPSSVLMDPPMTCMILPQTSELSSGSQLYGLSIALPRFFVPPSSASPFVSVTEQ